MPTQRIDIRLSLKGAVQVLTGLEGIQAAFGQVKTALGSLGAALAVHQLADFIGHAIDAADAAGKMAQKVGIDVESLTALQYAAQLSDISNEQLSVSLKKLSQDMVKTGQSSADMLEQLLSVADEFSQMQDGAFKTARAVELFGKSGIDMIPLLNQGSAAIRAQMEEARRFGIVIGPEFAANASEFNDNLKRLKAAGEGLALTLASALLPGLIRLTEAALEFVHAVQPALEWVRKWADGMSYLAIVTVKAYSNVIEASKGWEGFVGTLSSPMATAALAVAKAFADTLEEMRNPPPKVELPKGGGEFVPDPEQEKKALDLRRQLIQATYEAENAAFARLNAEALVYQKEREQIESLVISTESKNSLIETAEEAHRQRLAKIYQGNADDELREAERVERERKRIEQMRIAATRQMFGDLATIALAFGKSGFKAYKAFSIAQIVIDTILGAQKAFTALSGIPYIGPALGIAAAAAAIGAGAVRAAQIASTNPPGYQMGGYTGTGPEGQVAGPAHRGEFIFSAPDVQRIGLPAIEAFRGGDLAESGGGSTSVSVGGANVSLAMLNSHADYRNWLKSADGERIIVDMVSRNKMRLGIA